MGHIPSDVCREILIRLPANSLIRFRAVCKSWLSIIDDPCFVRTHTNKKLSSNTTTILIRNSTGRPFYSVDLENQNSSANYDHHNISAIPLNSTRSGMSRITNLRNVAACNGLLLIAPDGPDAINWEIWNPLTHERLELPQGNINRCIDANGLGYDYANDDYKAVVIDCESYQPKPTVFETHVYSLKSDSWRKIMDFPRGEGAFSNPGVFLSGALHWISSLSSSDDRYNITALHLRTESYRELKMPPYLKLNGHCQQLVDVLGGCLVLSDAGEMYFDLWVRKDYGAEDSWTKVFGLSGTQSNFFSFSPIVYMKNKTQVFLQEEEGFCLFDIESGSIKKVNIHGFCGNLSALVFHETIFRIHDNCGGGVVGQGKDEGKHAR